MMVIMMLLAYGYRCTQYKQSVGNGIYLLALLWSSVFFSLVFAHVEPMIKFKFIHKFYRIKKDIRPVHLK